MAATISSFGVQTRRVLCWHSSSNICYKIGLQLIIATVTHLKAFLTTGRLWLDCHDLHPMRIAVFENQGHVVVALHGRLAPTLLDLLAWVSEWYPY